MNNPRIKDLFDKYTSGMANQAEVEELLYYIQSGDSRNQIEEAIEQDILHSFGKVYTDPETIQRLDATHQVLMDHIEKDRKPGRGAFRLWSYITAVAGFLLIIGTIFYVNRQYLKEQRPKEVTIADVMPGGNKATLTLSNGKMINLDSLRTGMVADVGEGSVKKTADGQITYEAKKTGQQGPIKDALNIITTPKGGQYKVILPDGTEVWLNAATKLTYPVSFNGRRTREVSLSGEAYFQVAKDKKHPFIVETSKQQIRVLGTHFNVNAYAEEYMVKTTLLEGSVKVSTRKSEKVLKPGQQSELWADALTIKQADVEEVMAWKNGDFVFNGESIAKVMREVSRWYNIEVEYLSDMPSDGVYGKISRSKNINQVLKALELTKSVHFRIEGRKVFVTK